MPSTQPIKKA